MRGAPATCAKPARPNQTIAKIYFQYKKINHTSTSCYSGANREKLACVQASRQRPSWIPACAGMTTKREQVGCQPDRPFAMPDKCLTATPFVIPVKARNHLPSWQQKPEAISSSFRRRPESSGLDYTFPRSGNDNSMRWAARTGKSRCAYKHPGSALPGFPPPPE